MTVAPDLLQRIASLGVPYGFERSAKIAHGAVYDDRFLVSLHRSTLGADPLGRLLSIGEEFFMPAIESGGVAAAFEGADILHFGYERGEGTELYKVYFEYAERTRMALKQGDGAPALVHLALKWDRQRPERRAWTRYVWSGRRARADIETRLRELAPSAESPAAAHSLALLARAAARAPGAETLMMEVDEPGNPRRSWDINLYDAELTIGAVADIIEAAGADLGVNRERVRAVFSPRGSAALGHVSAGAGRGGEEFLTIYYGVEGRGGKQ